MRKTAFSLIPNYLPFVPKESIAYAVNTLKSGWIGGDGPRVKEFESEIGSIIRNKNVVALNSGTSALQMALRLIGVRGYEVISTPMTCVATNMAILVEGARPVWVDIEPQTGNIDPNQIESRITKKTKAIMVVHWGGAPADLDAISRIATRCKLPVIEDASQALGSLFGGKPIGNHSRLTAFSFQAIKIVHSVDGGLLVTKRKTDAVRARALRWYGVDREKRRWDQRYASWDFPIKEIGYKMQMTDVNAAIGLGQLGYLQGHLKHRRAIAELYEKVLERSTALKPQRILPQSVPNYWIFTVICRNLTSKAKLWKALHKIGVRAEVAHLRNDTYPVFKEYRAGKLPGVEFFNDHHLIIPVGHWVNNKKAHEIVDVLASF